LHASHINDSLLFLLLITQPPPTSTLFPYTTLFRSRHGWRKDLRAADERKRDRSAQPRLTRRSLVECDPGSSASGRIAGLLQTDRSEEHTSELQSRVDLVCRLLLEKKKNNKEKQTTR